jgi:hypothetical protein
VPFPHLFPRFPLIFFRALSCLRLLSPPLLIISNQIWRSSTTRWCFLFTSFPASTHFLPRSLLPSSPLTSSFYYIKSDLEEFYYAMVLSFHLFPRFHSLSSTLSPAFVSTHLLFLSYQIRFRGVLLRDGASAEQRRRQVPDNNRLPRDRRVRSLSPHSALHHLSLTNFSFSISLFSIIWVPLSTSS